MLPSWTVDFFILLFFETVWGKKTQVYRHLWKNWLKLFQFKTSKYYYMIKDDFLLLVYKHGHLANERYIAMAYINKCPSLE